MKQVLTIKRFSFLLCIIALLFSCRKSDDHPKKTVPLKATFQTITTLLQTGPPELDSIAGEGRGTPIGKSSFITHAQFDVSYNLTGAIVTTTENGDKFFAGITGHAPDINEEGDITLNFDAIITGGTGKYAGASGSFKGVAHESIYNSGGLTTWDGFIKY